MRRIPREFCEGLMCAVLILGTVTWVTTAAFGGEDPLPLPGCGNPPPCQTGCSSDNPQWSCCCCRPAAGGPFQCIRVKNAADCLGSNCTQ